MELKYSFYFNVLFLGVLTSSYAEVVLSRAPRTIWLDKQEETKRDDFKPGSHNTQVQNTKTQEQFTFPQDDGTKGHKKSKTNVEIVMTQLEQKNKKDVADQKLIKDKDSIIEIVKNRKISQDTSSFLQDVLLEFVKKYCASKYHTSDLQQCLLFCNLQQISKENFKEIPFPQQQRNTSSQSISNHGILTQNYQDNIQKKEIRTTKGQNINSSKDNHRHIQQHDHIPAKVVPTQTRIHTTKYLKRAKRQAQPLATLIRNRTIHGVKISEFSFIDRDSVIKGTAEANGLTFEKLDAIASVLEYSASYRSATLVAKLNSGYNGIVIVRF